MSSMIRQKIAYTLHHRYLPKKFDNSQVWAGNLGIEVNGEALDSAIARIYLDPVAPDPVQVVVSAEIYMMGITDSNLKIEPEDLDAHLWADFDDLGFMDEKGNHYPGFGQVYHMKPVTDFRGRIVVFNNNLRFVSEPITITRTGVFHYTVEFSADDNPTQSPAKAWLSLNEIALNEDGMIVVSPLWVRDCPSVTEVCLRKYGSGVENGKFKSGKIVNLTRDLENIPTQVVYLLPFFEPGTGDLVTGEDVRKGTLGSVYAVKDFYKIDPALVSPIEEADITDLVRRGLLCDFDLRDVLTPRQNQTLRRINDLTGFPNRRQLIQFTGRDSLRQLIGRAQMRELVCKARELGKRIIFDLVLMQTSRDNPLIDQHREWYALDEDGIPKRHKIAWLDYSDVALFNLIFNKPLQNYLSGIAPFWIKLCDFDGVRIDASQTVDKPFLKQIKNRIHAVKPDALVLGETLCDMNDAKNIPVDMIYSLLVDYHAHMSQASAYFDLFETIHHKFPPHTVAMAYFENHDSHRATRLWHEQYKARLMENPAIMEHWTRLLDGAEYNLKPDPIHETGLLLALMRNLQCSLMNLSAGGINGVNFAYALELGADWGEESRTDFENETTISLELRDQKPHRILHRAYMELEKLRSIRVLTCDGKVWYLRQPAAGAKYNDCLLAYAKFSDTEFYLIYCNLSNSEIIEVLYPAPFFSGKGDYNITPVFDTFAAFGLMSEPLPTDIKAENLRGLGLPIKLEPLRSVILRIEIKK